MLVAELDLKLLLAIQYACEKAYIAVPWDDVARVMGPATTGSDILDYLATTRTQMVARRLDVPPPLNFPGKIEKINGHSPYYSNSSDDKDEAWDVDDSDIKCGEPIVKRVKTSTQGSSKRKVQDDTGDGEHMNPEVILTGQRWLNSEDNYASHPKTDPRTSYKEGLVVSPTPTKKDVHEAVVRNSQLVDTVKSGSVHNHVRDDHIKGLDVPPPLKMNIGFLVTPTPTKKDLHKPVDQKNKVVMNDDSFSSTQDWSMGNPVPPYSCQSGYVKD